METRDSIARAAFTHRFLVGGALALAALMALPAIALAHRERPSYWPDPTPESIGEGVKVGGEVPDARPLKHAVTGKGPGEVHVVCKRNKGKGSLKFLKKSINQAKKNGYTLRPSQGKEKLSKKKAKQLMRWNKKLAKQCEYRSVQKAVTASGNNDFIVIMPGRYTEKASRNSEVNDPKCNPSLLQPNQSGSMTPSYAYQATCGNDQNLIHVAGRAVKGDPVSPPTADRHGVPKAELGKCVRCGLQIEGSGVKPEDVILDAGNNYIKPRKPNSRPGGNTPSSECHTGDEGNPCFGKHVVLRTDRADGFVGKNFLMRGAREHGFYTEETDGILLDRVKFFWNADYGHLSFTTDNHMISNCDGYGSGDAVVYPGAAPQTGEFRKESFYPEERFNTVIKKCDLRSSAMGYSGSMGNSVRVTQNNFYGNANGLTTDTLSAPGHPGFPADGMQIDNNWFYANNLDIYTEDPPFEPLVPQPVGTGFFWPGHNNGVFRDNYVFDNWGRGTFLISIPDALAGDPDGNVDPEIHCPTADSGTSTSCDNKHFNNHMGEVPPGFEPHAALTKFGNETSLLNGAARAGGSAVPATAPNGVDFWWDEATQNTGNCWFDNTGPDGTRGSLSADPPMGPAAGQSLPNFLPEDCDNSVGSGAYPAKAGMLLTCYAQYETREFDSSSCDWWDTPPRPASRAAARAQAEEQRALRRFGKTAEADKIEEWINGLAGEVSYGPTG